MRHDSTDSVDAIVLETAERLLKSHCTPQMVNDAERGVYPTSFWQAIQDSGLLLCLTPEAFGGTGASTALGMKLARLCGSYAAPIPFVESLIANWLLGEAGIESTTAPTFAIADACVQADEQGLSGRLIDVPFARHVEQLVVALDEGSRLAIALIPTDRCTIRRGNNLAGEARDTLEFQACPIQQRGYLAEGITLHHVKALAALFRACQIAGALDSMLKISLGYVQERQQFGRPIGKFQAVQAMLVDIASEAAATSAAIDGTSSAMNEYGLGDPLMPDIATAKIAAGTAATVAARAAHQAHGAMGFSLEYPLQQFSRRVWSWRDEYGSESEWAVWLARDSASTQHASLWDLICPM